MEGNIQNVHSYLYIYIFINSLEYGKYIKYLYLIFIILSFLNTNLFYAIVVIRILQK